MTIEGGTHIILKHSGKSPASRRKSEKSSTNQTKLKTLDSADRGGGTSKTRNQIESPVRFIRKQGIDVLLQDAAKAVYQQGEKWGVNKAVREAMDEMKRNMQGLQSTSSSPRRSTDSVRWSLDEGRHVSDPSTTTSKPLELLEQRNRDLAKILEGALKEMDSLMSNLNENKEAEEDRLATALKHVMTRIGAVKECLEDSRLPMPTIEEVGQKSVDDNESRAVISPDKRRLSDSHRVSKLVDSTLGLEIETPSKDVSPTKKGESGTSTATDAPRISSPTNKVSPSSSSLKGSRPALAESSFAWMLGESDLRSSFVASFPTPATERRHSRHGKTGFLFGNSMSERSASPEDGGRGDSLSLTNWVGERRDA